MQLLDFIKVYDNVLDPATCNQFIEEVEKRPSDFLLHDTPGYKFQQLNINQTDLAPIAQQIAQPLAGYARHYFRGLNLNQYVDVQGFEEVRIKKYLKNSNYEFKTHIDVTNKETAVRYLVFIIYLNDNNGVTTFENLNFSYKPKQGSMIMFPPTWMFPHAGTIPTDNDKYIMMTCLHYL